MKMRLCGPSSDLEIAVDIEEALDGEVQSSLSIHVVSLFNIKSPKKSRFFFMPFFMLEVFSGIRLALPLPRNPA